MSDRSVNSQRDVFLAVLDTPAAGRASVLELACEGDDQLRSDVLELLEAHKSVGDFLEVSPWTGTAHETVSWVEEGTSPTAAARSGAEISSHQQFDVQGLLSPCETPDRLGQIDHYEVIEVIGRGGMGIVLKAFDTRLQRIVAVKVMSADLAISNDARVRFLREARAAAAVHHDHVVAIHAVEECAGRQYLVMEFVEGQSLQQYRRNTPQIEIAEVLRIGREIAEGLAAAHRAGLVHRDIKPGNILLEQATGRVKITDFGLARSRDDAGITHTGQIVGTPEYMAPEQAQGGVVDQRADLFSLGCVLYALCAGSSPFHAHSALAALRRVCDDQAVSLDGFDASIPRGLKNVIARLLDKNPARRIQAADEVAIELRREQQLMDSGEQTTRILLRADSVASGLRTRVRTSVIAAASLLLLLALSESFGWTTCAVTVLRIVRGDATSTNQASARFLSEPDKPRVEIPGQRTADSDEWSPPVRIDTLGVAKVIRGRPTVSGDGLTLVFESDAAGGFGELDLWMSTRESLDDSFPTAVNLGPPVNSQFRAADPCLSSDGLTLIFASRRLEGSQGKQDLWISTRASRTAPFGEPANLGSATNTADNEGSPCLSSDGLTLIFASARTDGFGRSDLWMSKRPALGESFGDAVNLGPTINSAGLDSGACLTADDLELWFASDRNPTLGVRDLWRSRRASRDEPFGPPQNVGTSINSSGDEESPAFTADGQVLIFESNRLAPDDSIGQEKTLESIWMSTRVNRNLNSGKDRP